MLLRKTILSCGLLVLMSIVSGCVLVPGLRVSASGNHPDAGPGYKVLKITPEVIAQQNAEMSGQTSTGVLPPVDSVAAAREYLVGPGDVLQIVIWDHMELTNPFGAVTRDPVASGQLVAADGTIFFPYAGVIRAAGRTVEQIRVELADKLKVVVNKPQVDVRVAAFRSGRIQVTGEVKNPGLVTIDDTVKGVLEAITERGGLNPTASRRTALLIRNGASYRIDLADLLSGQHPAINPLLMPGDIVHVPDTGDDQVYVLGETGHQGPVTMGQQQLTLIEALTKAGGLDKLTADDAGVLIFRRPTAPGQVAQIFALDLGRPAGLLLAGEFDLAARDVVYVKATKFAQYNLIINQLLPTITAVYQIDALTN